MTIHKTMGVKKDQQKRCRFCRTTKGELMVHSGKKGDLTYYSCRNCQRQWKREWYQRSEENRKKQKEYNRRYLLKLKNKKNG